MCVDKCLIWPFLCQLIDLTHMHTRGRLDVCWRSASEKSTTLAAPSPLHKYGDHCCMIEAKNTHTGSKWGSYRKSLTARRRCATVHSQLFLEAWMIGIRLLLTQMLQVLTREPSLVDYYPSLPLPPSPPPLPLPPPTFTWSCSAACATWLWIWGKKYC